MTARRLRSLSNAHASCVHHRDGVSGQKPQRSEHPFALAPEPHLSECKPGSFRLAPRVSMGLATHRTSRHKMRSTEHCLSSTVFEHSRFGGSRFGQTTCVARQTEGTRVSRR